MKRRFFLESMAGTLLASGIPSVAKTIVKPDARLSEIIPKANKGVIPDSMQEEFVGLLKWLDENGWNTFFKKTFNVDISFENPGLQTEIVKEIANVNKAKGFEDFGGLRMIEDGQPAMSALYHALASPRVKPRKDGEYFTATNYPSLSQLDFLENYIYALKTPDINPDEFSNDFVFAVFSYEYRPAYKQPNGCNYAEFAYCRTGIGRIGKHPVNYDRENRCFTNKPTSRINPKEIAVTPARYGLFLAKRVGASEVNLISEERNDSSGFLFFKKERSFLQPVRKIFDGDPYIGGARLNFSESHRNEKLKRLANVVTVPDEFTLGAPPFMKISATDALGNRLVHHNSNLVNVSSLGSSVLISSIPADIIRVAQQSEKTVSFKVPKKAGLSFTSNRRYTSCKLQIHPYRDAMDFAITEGLLKKYKATRFHAPRNAPLFTHIRSTVDKDFQFQNCYIPDTEDKISKLDNGDYLAAMFEDNICDGCVAVKVTFSEEIDKSKKSKLRNCLPAFSVVTAPDFFPLVDSFDLENYDKHGNSSFLEGGIENLSSCRLGVNPLVENPITGQKAFPFIKSTDEGQHEEQPKIYALLPPSDPIEYEVSDTLVAVISGIQKPTNPHYPTFSEIYTHSEKRDYNTSSYLADCASFVFAPGWDITYSSDRDYPNRPFLATFGLGSPFPEDMKLCAAANGMWPVTSPDAARTFQGSLEPLPVINKRTPCAIPLMDDEIGIHDDHPALKEEPKLIAGCFGWDGEQGPFFKKYGNNFWINFTDIGRADYVNNILSPAIGLDMEKLRALDCTELTHRIDSARKCKTALEGTKKEFSELWLVSAEKVNWSGNIDAASIPMDLVGSNRDWVKIPQNSIKGDGYLFIYADPIYDDYDNPQNYNWEGTRRKIPCTSIYVCQVNRDALSWCKIPPTGLANPGALKWQHA